MPDIQIKDLAEVLNNRIRSFEKLLAESPFKATATVEKADCFVTFKRVKEEWKILVKKSDDPEKWVMDCSLNTKMAAIDLFIGLTEAIKDSRKDLENRLGLAIDKMDTILDGVGNA